VASTILASEIIEKVKILLLDTTVAATRRWPDPELLGWLNSGQRDIVVLKPNANTETREVTMIAGTRQSIPDDCYALIEVVRNVGGRAILPINREALDATRPDWHQATARAEAQYYVFDSRDQETFYLYPPQPATPGDVEIILSVLPADVPAVGSVISLDDSFETILIDYIMFRAFTKDGSNSKAAERAAMHFSSFRQSLGLKGQAEDVMNPDVEFYKQRSRDRRRVNSGG